MHTVAIVDDDPENVEALKFCLETAGSKIIAFTDNFQNMNSLLEEIMRRANGVLCDNRLNYRTTANFTGAEAVANWFDLKFPAILVSEFTDQDINTTIRSFRRKIPFVIPQDHIDIQKIITGFAICKQEIANQPPPFRKPIRAIVQVVKFTNNSVETYVPQWNPHRVVTFPRSLLGKYKNKDLTRGTLFIADVNIGANNSDELFFENFELAPEPDDADGLA